MTLINLSTLMYKRKRLDGVHHGVVVDNADPDKLGHLKVEVPGVMEGDPGNLPWCAPKLGFFLGGSEASQQFVVPVTGATVTVEFDGPYCPYYTGWVPDKKTANDLFHRDYPQSYGMIDGEFVAIAANRKLGDVLLAKQTPAGERTVVYFGPEGELDVTTASGVSFNSATKKIELRAKEDLNMETMGEDGSTWLIRGKLFMDVHDGLRVKSTGGNLTVEVPDNEITVDSGGNVTLTTAGDLTIKVDGKIKIDSGGDMDLTAGGDVNIKGGKINLN